MGHPVTLCCLAAVAGGDDDGGGGAAEPDSRGQVLRCKHYQRILGIISGLLGIVSGL
jgi:hypothetical protein